MDKTSFEYKFDSFVGRFLYITIGPSFYTASVSVGLTIAGVSGQIVKKVGNSTKIRNDYVSDWKMAITWSGNSGIISVYKAGVSSPLTDRLKQSCVENLFSILCGKGGHGSNGGKIPQRFFPFGQWLPMTVKAITWFAAY